MQHNPPQALISHPDKPVQTNTDNNTSPITPSPITPSTQQASANDSPTSFDLGSFLAGFGIDPFLVPPQPDTDLSSASSLTKPSVTSQSPPGGPSSSVAKPGDETQPPSKRARTRKTSLPSSVASIEPDALQSASIRTRAVSELSDDHDPLSTPLTAAEDKRRRNTAASARFRAKKKEREQALERRSKELETRVNELERECEGLRRENGWLKGLVVGVTGNNTSVSNPTPAEEANSSKKRKRETDGGTLDS
ncbi:hypothetical protein K439DRAFT_1639201 [Ramaria rubella]|nr:hypothetical protein K439DRAFT_1639201 [Ramaria rubella]